MSKIYIAGPITSLPLSQAEENFKKVRLMLESMGWFVTDPFLLNKNKTKSWLGYMIVDFFQLIKCDSIYMLQGWNKSKGAKIEHWVARLLRFKIIYQI